MRSIVTSVALLATLVALSGAQQATFKRTELQRGDLSAAGREAVMAVAEIPGGVQSGRHTHPGEEIGYILEGSVVLEMDGKPARTLKAGDAFIIPNGQIHNARNTGSSSANLIVGNDGANVLDGKGGGDVLAGLGGADVFNFTTALDAGNVDRIDDFEAGADRIALDDAIVADLNPGSMDPNRFVLGPEAEDADDRVIYDPGSGALLFDHDGSGAGAAVPIAMLAAGLALAATDLIIV